MGCNLAYLTEKHSHSTCLEELLRKVVYKQEWVLSIQSDTEIMGNIWRRKALHLQFQTQVTRINEMRIRQNSETEKSSNSLKKGTFRIFPLLFLENSKKNNSILLYFFPFIVHLIPHSKFCYCAENGEVTLLKIHLSMTSIRTFSSRIAQMQ